MVMFPHRSQQSGSGQCSAILVRVSPLFVNCWFAQLSLFCVGELRVPTCLCWHFDTKDMYGHASHTPGGTKGVWRVGGDPPGAG